MDKELKKCYNILGIKEDSDQDKIRSTYLKLVKQYHPDSGTSEADSNKFQEIDKAFKVIINKKSKERWDADEVDFEIHAEEYDIKHTAPQHRQYLNYGGIGMGSPFQREKQYSKIRAMHAVENVLNHRISKAQADEKTLMDKKPQKHKIKTKYGYDRLVEDLIQESMQKGEFDNLSGKGKPLKGLQSTNPYVDFVTHKINQVLIDNGFTPEWIMLQKEIREDKLILQRTLYADRTKIGSYPFNNIDQCKWEKLLEDAKKINDSINKKIEKYNLVVPVLQKQMLLFDLKREAEKVAKYGQTKHDIEALNAPMRNEARENPKNIFSFFESFFYTK
ncbi:uncharacterized protein CBL_05237 [Carabus blaptoides fortunei]